MKLKIEYIQDLISEVSSAFDTHPIIAKSGTEYTSINYHQPVAYIAKQIYDSILMGVKDQALEDVYTMRYYSEFSGCGFYLGVPYYSVRCNPDVIKLYDDLLAKEKELSAITKCISEYQTFIANAASYDIAERKQIIARLQKDNYVQS